MLSAIAKDKAVVSTCIYSVIKLILHRKNLHNFSFNRIKPRQSIIDGLTNTKLKPHLSTKTALKFILQKPSNCGKHNLVSET